MTHTVSKTVSDETLNCIITIESGGRPTIKASTSSASGLFQFIDATWMGVVAKHRPDLLNGRTRAQILALRFDPKTAIELGARFTEDNQRVIGMGCSGGDLYLAHFLGTGAAADLFRADPSTPVSKLVSAGAINANKSVLLGKNAGQVRAWAAKRMNASAGNHWIAKYYKVAAPVAVMAEAEPAEAVEDIPDPQVVLSDPPEAVTLAPEQAPAPVDEKPEHGTFFKLLKSKIVWASNALGGLSLAGIGGFLTDWKVIAVICAALLIAYIIYERSKKP